LIFLKDLTDINPGYPFRGKIEEQDCGSVSVVQMKNVDDLHQLDRSSLIKTELQGRKSPNWLQQSDILFIARGNRNYAIYLDKITEQAVCSPHFFQLQVTEKQTIHPAFLAWQINQPFIQRYLTRSTEGGVIGNIRRSVLEEIPVVVPPISQQLSIVALDNANRHQQALFQQQITNNHRMMNAIAQKLVRDIA
jgi:restriction endonuclease S subunit